MLDDLLILCGYWVGIGSVLVVVTMIVEYKMGIK